MNGKIFAGKPIHITLTQRKEDRITQLQVNIFFCIIDVSCSSDDRVNKSSTKCSPYQIVKFQVAYFLGVPS